MSEYRKRFPPVVTESAPPTSLAGRFFAAGQSGDVRAIEALLTAHVTLVSDGGGKAFAAKLPVTGIRKVANLLAVVFRKLRQVGEMTVAAVNGRPGVVFTVGGRPVEVLSFAPDGDAVGTVYVVLNPDKLRRWPVTAGDGGEARPGPWEKTDGTPTELREAVP